MFWNKEKGKSSNNLFLWGAIAGLALGIYATKTMGNNTMDSKQNNHKSDEGKSGLENQLNNMSDQEKQKLFESFLKDDTNDLKEKASDFDLQN